MSETEKFINIKKHKSGDLVFELKPINYRAGLKALIKLTLTMFLKIFVPFFKILDAMAERRKLVISSVGLGIGLGLSVIITQRPDAIQAFPTLISLEGYRVAVAVLRIPSIDLSVSVEDGHLQDIVENFTTDHVIHEKRSAGLGSKQTIVLADASARNLLPKLEEVTIGNEILLVGENNGTYNYRVTEVRSISAEYLPTVIADSDNALIIYKSNNLFRTHLHIVIARPVK